MDVAGIQREVAASLICLLAFAAPMASADDQALEIVRKSVLVDQANEERTKDYTFTEREEERKPDAQGHMRSAGSKTWDTVILYGRPFRRLIARNDKPLADADKKKEQERFDREVEKRKNESPKDRQRAVAEQEKDRKEARKFLDEVANVYNFRLLGEEPVSGHDTWVISAEPKPGYKPQNSDAANLLKMHGKLWIDKDGYHWVKVQAQVLNTISWGLFVVRMNPGSAFEFEQTRVNDEVWLPRHVLFHLNARLVFKKYNAEIESTWSGFLKFATDSRIVSTGSN